MAFAQHCVLFRTPEDPRPHAWLANKLRELQLLAWREVQDLQSEGHSKVVCYWDSPLDADRVYDTVRKQCGPQSGCRALLAEIKPSAIPRVLVLNAPPPVCLVGACTLCNQHCQPSQSLYNPCIHSCNVVTPYNVIIEVLLFVKQPPHSFLLGGGRIEPQKTHRFEPRQTMKCAFSWI